MVTPPPLLHMYTLLTYLHSALTSKYLSHYNHMATSNCNVCHMCIKCASHVHHMLVKLHPVNLKDCHTDLRCTSHVYHMTVA